MNLNNTDLPASGSKNTVSKSTTLHRKILSLAILQAFACGSTAVYAANITVDSTADSVTVDGNCTLREALQAADADGTTVDNCTVGAGSDTIDFDNSISGSTITLGGTELAIASDLTIDGDIDNDGTADITVDANNASRVFNIDTTAADKAVTFEGLTITGGSNTEGGGIFCQYSTYNCNLTVSNSTITGNTATTLYGGGIRTFYGTTTLTNSTVSGNTADRNGGGIASNYGSINLTNSTMSNNTATTSRGGAITSRYADVNLTNSTVSGNTSRNQGGGIYTSYGSTSLTDSTVSGNTSTNSRGGGIHSNDGNITLTNSTVSGNTTTSRQGGGISSDYGNVTLTNSTVSGNTASNSQGGGIYNYEGILTITNSTISGNTASGDGGGIYTYYGSLSLSNSTITNNSTGIYGYDTPLNIINSILANNGVDDCNGSFVVGSNTSNLVTDGGANCGMTPALTVDPQLGVLANNGGPTLTHLPMAGSPVLDAGDNVDCGTGKTIATDQRGAARDDGSCDIGAVEGTVSIETPASVQLDSTTATVSEDGSTITLNLTRSGDTVSAISVDYSTSDGTATAPGDYTADANTLNFATGVTSQSVTVAITDDSTAESDENFALTLSNVQLVTGSAPVALGVNTTTTVTITDDDASTSGATTPSASSSSSALGLSPWWSLLMLTSWLRRKFKS